MLDTWFFQSIPWDILRIPITWPMIDHITKLYSSLSKMHENILSMRKTPLNLRSMRSTWNMQKLNLKGIGMTIETRQYFVIRDELKHPRSLKSKPLLTFILTNSSWHILYTPLVGLRLLHQNHIMIEVKV